MGKVFGDFMGWLDADISYCALGGKNENSECNLEFCSQNVGIRPFAGTLKAVKHVIYFSPDGSGESE